VSKPDRIKSARDPESSTSIEQEWNTQDWLNGANVLIHWSHTLAENASFMLVIRHSHRETIASYDDMVGRGLTGLGHRMAREFGRRLPLRKNTRIFHSIVPRCSETAEDIAEGIHDAGGRVDLIKGSDLLVGPRVIDSDLWQKIGRDGIRVIEFVEEWRNGMFTKEQMEPYEKFRARVAREMVRKLRLAPDGSMYLHVTHDLFLVAAGRVIQTIYASAGQRPDYLGGFGVVPEVKA
jgi:broad specificity phosphatase PhoE